MRPVSELQKRFYKPFPINDRKAAWSIILVYGCTVEVIRPPLPSGCGGQVGGKAVEIKTFLAQTLLTIVGACLQPAYPSNRYVSFEKEKLFQKWKPRRDHGSLCIRPPPLREAA